MGVGGGGAAAAGMTTVPDMVDGVAQWVACAIPIGVVKEVPEADTQVACGDWPVTTLCRRKQPA